MSSNGKSYITIQTSEINTVNFAEVLEQKDTRRESVDKSEFVVKWTEGAPYMPSSIEAIPSDKRSAIMDHKTARELMATPEWTNPNPPE